MWNSFCKQLHTSLQKTFEITNSADGKGADCWLEAFCLVKRGFWPGSLSGTLLLFFPIFYEKKKSKKCDTLTLPTHRW